MLLEQVRRKSNEVNPIFFIKWSSNPIPHFPAIGSLPTSSFILDGGKYDAPSEADGGH